MDMYSWVFELFIFEIEYFVAVVLGERATPHILARLSIASLTSP